MCSSIQQCSGIHQRPGHECSGLAQNSKTSDSSCRPAKTTTRSVFRKTCVLPAGGANTRAPWRVMNPSAVSCTFKALSNMLTISRQSGVLACPGRDGQEGGGAHMLHNDKFCSPLNWFSVVLFAGSSICRTDSCVLAYKLACSHTCPQADVPAQTHAQALATLLWCQVS